MRSYNLFESETGPDMHEARSAEYSAADVAGKALQTQSHDSVRLVFCIRAPHFGQGRDRGQAETLVSGS